MASLIEKYRACQRRIRRCFAPYTAELCPECAEPCCRKPTKVSEFDVLLANACGCAVPSANDAVSGMVQAGLDAMTGVEPSDVQPEPCDYLGPDGCVFPDDLRPYQCARYICHSLKRAITPHDMRELRDLLHKLGVLHRELVDAAGRVGQDSGRSGPISKQR